jgi:hypothetical protein
MRIQSVDNRCYLEINPTSEGYGLCRVEARIDLGHGVFTAENKSLLLLKLPKFIIQLGSFIVNREPQPKLEGTYDSYLSFVSKADSVFLEFSLGDGFCGYRTYAPFNLTGRFQLDADQLGMVLSDFRTLAEKSY